MKVLNKYFTASVVLLLMFAAQACKDNRWDPDVSNIEADVQIDRFDKALFSIDTSHWMEGVEKVKKQYPDVYEAYVQYLWPIGPADSPKTAQKLKIFIASPYWKDSLYKDVEKKYDDASINRLEGDFEEAFRHYKYYYPKDKLPEVVTVLKGYNPNTITPGVFTYKNTLGISLDMFMGADYRYYQMPGLSEYQIRRFEEPYIVPNALKAMFSDKFPEEQLTDRTMLSQVVHLGKILFFIDAMMPDTHDTLKIEYTGKQLEWANESEGQIWEHFVNEDLLYTTDQRTQAKYLSDGPFTNAAGVPAESAPRIGEFMGWRIVKKYMQENPDVTLQQFMLEKDYRKILNKAKYKPK